MTETEYVLPKTYNGKTVTELFPEFKHDSVSKNPEKKLFKTHL